MTYLHTIEHALWAAAKRHLPARAITGKNLANAICERSVLYTRERDLLAERPSGRVDADLAARALFFTIADAAKIRVPIAELINRGVFPAATRLRVADMGAGAGAMSLGLLSLRPPGQSIELTAVDRDAGALAILRSAIAELPPAWRDGLEVTSDCADVRKWRTGGGGFDLIIAGTLLNEMTSDAAFDMVSGWMDWLSDDGAVVIIEPALRDTSRALHELRDRIIEAERGHVFAPCTRRIAPCPMLADDKDWCHEDRHVDLPERISQLVRTTGLRTQGLKFSYLVLRKQPGGVADDDGERAVLRLVSRPRKLKGRLECFVCGQHGRTRLRLLKRNRSDLNRDLEAARRGDVLIAAPTDDVAADAQVDVLSPSAVD